MLPLQNIELKARLASLAAAREVAKEVATEHLGSERQIDTYFVSSHGRLKLREIEGRQSQLVWYQRPDQASAKQSDYLLVPVAAPAALKAALARACGTRVVVVKCREIFLADNVRIHLDQVAGLGEFLEFEAVLGEGVSAELGRSQVAELATRFGIEAAQLIDASYADLLSSG
ncbi:MAG TPA: class IV adenylate cyclase [Pirellulales bacterium]|jgi:predicted adenylyl cyclase CyaB|nr:class IV adenylate cyclase [Pirellulales bacterium]